MCKSAINFNNDNDYYTPKKIIDYFRSERWPIDYDPATTPELAAYHNIPNFTALPDNGLETDWTEYHSIWVNPPFTLKKEFWYKAVETYRRAQTTIHFLCPISFLTTKAFSEVEQPVLLYLPPGRIKFERSPKGGEIAKAPAFGSVIIRPNYEGHIAYMPKEVIK